MKQCFGYVRVSTQKQGEGVSLEAQRDAILAFASRQNLSVTRWFEEKETAAKSGRPVFNQMLKLLQRGAASGLIMHKIDRSARNLRDWAIISELPDAGIDVHIATESLDFRSRGGRLTADIQAVIAADYIRNLREETIKGLTGRLKQGLYPFKAPIGYVDNGGGKPKTIDSLRGPLVRQAFELYASGQHSLRSLLVELERRGLRSERGRPITKCCLENLLANPFYCGLIRIRRTGAVYQGAHEPLIPVSLYEEVQCVRSGKCGKKVTRHNHLYRGLFRCASCDAAMTPELQKGHVYYRCQTRGCPTTTVREDRLETAIQSVLGRIRLRDQDIDWLETEIESWLASRSDASRVLTITGQINQLQDKIDRLTDALIDRLIDRDTFARRKETLELELVRLREAKSEAERCTPKPGHVRRFLELVKNLAQTYISADRAEKREIVETTTSNRRVQGKSIIIEPSKWLAEAETAIAGLCGAPRRTTSRTGIGSGDNCAQERDKYRRKQCINIYNNSMMSIDKLLYFINDNGVICRIYHS
ncbi:MAG: recombinase family protein [Alphaproteobacteria bacterium]|nr:MAG: recombinase family protein [Alphaproteobacteria bacterium]